jgi:hypothetical protein
MKYQLEGAAMSKPAKQVVSRSELLLKINDILEANKKGGRNNSY